MDGGTTFHFVTDGIGAALEQARAAAGERDILIAGGASTVNQFLAAGHVDEIYLHVAPVVLGGGERLFVDVGDPKLEPVEVVATPNATHVRYRVRAEEVREQSLAVRGQHRLGVELDALGRQLAVADAHQHAAAAGGRLELVRAASPRRRPASGSARRSARRQARRTALAVVLDLRRLAVDRLVADDRAAERLGQRLVAEADAERRDAGLGKRRIDVDRDARPPSGVHGPGETTTRSGRALEQLVDAARRRCGRRRPRARARPGTGRGCR